jgi:hypothetical protein
VRQIGRVRATFPQFKWKVTRAGGVDWSGTLQPSLESPCYSLRLLHEPNRVPRVWIVAPKIRFDAPHRYAEDRSLCLFWPKEWRWTPLESLADTIIPWAAFWLYYYELWCTTSEWLGPSSPHGSAIKEAA